MGKENGGEAFNFEDESTFQIFNYVDFLRITVFFPDSLMQKKNIYIYIDINIYIYTLVKDSHVMHVILIF